MSTRIPSSRSLKRRILTLLKSKDFERALEPLRRWPARQVVNPLFSFLLSTDPEIKWSSVTAMGAVVANLADQDLESARVIMRRLMWQLNDESGGIGWGCAETMGEIMACHERLAQEYAHVLVSYVMEKGNFLEYKPLQVGAVWAIGRLAQIRPYLVRNATPHLLPFLQTEDGALRGHAAWALGVLEADEARPAIERLLTDELKIEIYRDREVREMRVKDLAREALIKIGNGL